MKEWARRIAGSVRTLAVRARLVGGVARDAVRSRATLCAENALLRQQLIVARRSVKTPRIRGLERSVMASLARLVPEWREAVLLVQPATLLRWHRERFRMHWARRSRAGSQRPRRVTPETVALIQRMARENALWGAERIRGELLKLGIRVAKRTVQRHMRTVRQRGPRGPSWRAWVRAHRTWAVDFLDVYDWKFRPLSALCMVDVNSRRVVHASGTRAPSACWTARQVRSALRSVDAPDVLVCDHDDRFAAVDVVVASTAETRVVRTAVGVPTMNAIVERFLGSVRRECLDHVLLRDEHHLEALLSEYSVYFNLSRPHQGIGQKVPCPRVMVETGPVHGRPVLGGLHRVYERAA